MGKPQFRMVAAGDGGPPSPTGYSYYLLVHALGTVLLLVALVAAIWQFMDWAVAPATCLESGSRPAMSAVTAAAKDAAAALAPTPRVQDASRITMAAKPVECPCP
jgi:hypothetical protein